MDTNLTAYAAATQVLAAASVRQLAACEFEDAEVCSTVVEVDRQGQCTVTLCNRDGIPVGGYTL